MPLITKDFLTDLQSHKDVAAAISKHTVSTWVTDDLEGKVKRMRQSKSQKSKEKEANVRVCG